MKSIIGSTSEIEASGMSATLDNTPSNRRDVIVFSIRFIFHRQFTGYYICIAFLLAK